MMALVALAASASACSTSDKPVAVVKTVYAERETPAAAKVPCADPVTLPDRKLTETEASNYWGTDRTNLRTCEARRAAAVGGENVQ